MEAYEMSFCGLPPVKVLSQYGSRTIISVAGITPIELFKTRIIYTRFASDRYFWQLGAKFVGKIAAITTHQDRQVRCQS